MTVAVTAWGQIVADTIAAIEGITPTVDPGQRWREIPRGRGVGDSPGRLRSFRARAWESVGDVQVYGGGEDQLGRDLHIVATYYDAADLEDMRHADEIDIAEAVGLRSGYPSGSGWALEVRRLVREDISLDEPEDGVVTVDYPIRHIWREPVSHI